MRGRFFLASRPPRCLSFKSLSISITLLCPLLASAFTCPATDKVGGALTKSDPGVEGAVVCTYTSGVCTFPSNGELDRLSSTSIQCPRVAVPDVESSKASSSAPASSAPISTPSSPPPQSSATPDPPPNKSEPDTPTPESKSQNQSQSVTSAAVEPTRTTIRTNAGPSSSAPTSSDSQSGGNLLPTGGPSPEPNSAASHSTRTIAIAVSISAVAVVAIFAALLLRWRRQRRRQQALDEEYLTPERFIPGQPTSPSDDLAGGYANRDSKRGAEKTKTLVPSRPSSRNAGETDSFLSSRVERMEAQLQSLMTTTATSTTGAPVTRVGEAPPQYSR
ncbi:hypothetical protein R3P38DRAFT_3282448 [Favolaschia claudopus]|uniref:Uncharacterized protein n=1 Tax=Favolaschia claudopus TaxID=2862362 RepID=A0AAW0ADD8_9AGAR